MGQRSDVHLGDGIAIMKLVPDYDGLLLFRRCYSSVRYHLN